MIRRSFFFNIWIMISAIGTGFVLMFNWCSRHPYLVFFQSKLALYGRYLLAMSCAFLLFSALRALVRELTPKASEIAKKLYFQFDTLTNLLLTPLLVRRYFMPGRAEGNRYYLLVFSGWLIAKTLLFLVLFDKETFKEMPRALKELLIKSKFIWKKVSQKREYNLNFFLLVLVYAFSIQFLFTRAFPKFVWVVPLSYTLLFFSGALLLKATARAFFPKRVFSFLLYAVTLLCVISTLDFFCYELLNIHFSDCVSALFADGILQAHKALEGADLNPINFCLMSVLVFVLPILGISLYKRLPSKKIKFSILLPLVLTSAMTGATFLGDQLVQKRLPPSRAQSLVRACPVYPFFLESQGEKIHYSSNLMPPPSEETFQGALKTSRKLKGAPNVFVFVIESFRDDYIDQTTAPYLSEFKKSSPSFDLTASNSNVTHISLFTLYTGLYPHHWITLKQQNYQMGSYPLNLLKESGYKLHALHSSFFKYFGIGDVIFGKDYKLLDTLYEAKHLCPDVAKRDRMTIDEAKSLTQTFKSDSSNFVTILLDSTHHHYYWPEGFEVPHKEYLESFNYTNKGKEQLELTKNRYRNSIYYVDGLIQEFCNHLKAEGLYDDSVIMITGDHGEEFMEHGHYFHGTDLCLPQSHVPILYKFPKGFSGQVKTSLSSHVDFFPSLFEVIGLSYSKELLHGQSIFSSNPSFILSFRPQYKKNPYQFYLHNGQEKIEAKFVNSEEIYKSRGIEITAIKDLEEKVLPFEEPGSTKEHALSVFEEPLERLFFN